MPSPDKITKVIPLLDSEVPVNSFVSIPAVPIPSDRVPSIPVLSTSTNSALPTTNSSSHSMSSCTPSTSTCTNSNENENNAAPSLSLNANQMVSMTAANLDLLLKKIKDLEAQNNEKAKQIEEKDTVIKDKDKMLNENEKVIKEKEKVIREKDKMINEKDKYLGEKEFKLEMLTEKNTTLIKEKCDLRRKLNKARRQIQSFCLRKISIKQKREMILKTVEPHLTEAQWTIYPFSFSFLSEKI